METVWAITLSDAVMPACPGGLRTLVDRREALPADPPVALAPGVGGHRGGDRPLDQPGVDALGRPADRRARPPPACPPPARVDVQQQGDLLGASGSAAHRRQRVLAAGCVRAMRLSARLRLGSRRPRGTWSSRTCPLAARRSHAGGARLEHCDPVSTMVEGQGLNITVQSYLDRLDWALSPARSWCRTSTTAARIAPSAAAERGCGLSRRRLGQRASSRHDDGLGGRQRRSRTGGFDHLFDHHCS
jgi:diacylglycerol O-acyltransferase / wax synthase